jgi:hypothetical protein
MRVREEISRKERIETNRQLACAASHSPLQTDLIPPLILHISSDKQATQSNKHQTQNDPS